jgi:hypothetical protein
MPAATMPILHELFKLKFAPSNLPQASEGANLNRNAISQLQNIRVTLKAIKVRHTKRVLGVGLMRVDGVAAVLGRIMTGC